MRALVFAMAVAVGAPGIAVAAPQSPPVPAARADAFARAAASAGAVFEGVVVDVGRAPGFWPGVLAAGYQSVTYRVVRAWHVAPEHRLAAGALVTVRHAIVEPSETVDDTPQLRPALVHRGARVIVVADWRDAQWTDHGERAGIAPDDAAHRAALGRR